MDTYSISSTPTPALNGSMLPPTGFQPASSILKASPGPAAGSLRNASGGQDVVPKDDVLAPKPDGASSEGTPAVVVPSKPINRPATSKNAIVYNAVQVSPADCF